AVPGRVGDGAAAQRLHRVPGVAAAGGLRGGGAAPGGRARGAAAGAVRADVQERASGGVLPVQRGGAGVAARLDGGERGGAGGARALGRQRACVPCAAGAAGGAGPVVAAVPEHRGAVPAGVDAGDGLLELRDRLHADGASLGELRLRPGALRGDGAGPVLRPGARVPGARVQGLRPAVRGPGIPARRRPRRHGARMAHAPVLRPHRRRQRLAGRPAGAEPVCGPGRGRPPGHGACRMKTVITYGTFDILHVGHINLLRRARALGDRLVVGLSTDEFNQGKHKSSLLNYENRKAVLEAIRYVDEVFPENSWGQKQDDIRRYSAAVFVMGDDWAGKFDFLSELCEVHYLPRTRDVSTTAIKASL